MNTQKFLEKYFRGWKLGIGNTCDPVQYVTDSEMRTKTVTCSNDEVIIIWQGHETLGSNFQVTVKWRREEKRYEAEFIYNGYSGKEFVEEIIFPIMEHDFAPDCEFISSHDIGFIRRGKTLFKPGSKERINFPSMQFCALIRDKKGFYIDHRDSENYIKEADIEISETGTLLTYSPIFYQGVAEKPTVSGKIPYMTSVAEFTGSWFEAALIYREWALKQSWYLNRTQVNPLRDIGMWVWNRGLIQDVMPPVEQLQKALPEVPIALDWYWWHSNPYDTDYPDFWPPREGVDNFRNAVKRMTEQGIYTQVYINGVCWDLDGPSWAEGGEESIIIRRNREPVAIAFNTYNHHRLGSMCGEAPKFQDRISALVKKLAASGLSGQYLDMIGGATCFRCYNPTHKHDKGGGNFSIKGYREMLRRLKEENPGFVLTTEYANEAYMDLCDGGIICISTSSEHLGTEREYIPLFTAIYHGGYALFGNYASPDGTTPWDPLWPPEERWKNEKKWHVLYPEQFYVEMARPVIWGAQPMVCNLKPQTMTDPEFADIYAFIRHTAEFYYHNREFLFDGEMLSPDGFSCGQKEVEFMARMIFTKEDNCKVIKKTMPCLLHCCWQAPDGRKALFIANYTAEIQEWSFNGRKSSISARSYAKIEL